MKSSNFMNMKKFYSILCLASVALCSAGALLSAKGKHVPLAQEESPVTIVASLLSGSGVTSSDLGLYSFNVNNPDERTPVLKGPVATYGGVAIDGIYYCNTKTSWMGMFNFYDVYGYDLSTGEQVMDYDEDDATAYFAQGGMNLDPVTGDAIGIFYDGEMLERQLALVSYGSSGPSKNILAELSDPSLSFNAFAVDGEGGCWAISMAGDLYSIDRQTGECVNIGPTGFVPSAIGGAIIDPANGKMYWAVSPSDGSGRLVEVNLATGVGTQISIFSDNAQWNGLYLPEAPTAPDAPAACTDLSAQFPEGSMIGTLSLKVPATLFGGQPGSGNISVSAFVNGSEIGVTETTWGANLTINVDLSNYQPGQFEFMVYASNEAGNGPRTKLKNVWIGSDTPSAPVPSLSYQNNKMIVAWDAVSSGLNGGYVDPASVRYTVFNKDTTLIASDISALSYEIPVTPPAQNNAKAYQYIVKASIGSASSQLAKTNTVALGALSTPFEADFSKSGLDAFTIIDANNDGIEWSLYNESEIGISIHYNEDLDMDDWLISPPLDMEAGKAYAVSFCTYSMESYYAERIEVKWGNDNNAEAMSGTILPPTLLPNMQGDALRVTKYICPPVSGRYFIGFHGISDKDKFDLILSEFTVGAAVSSSVPAACTDLGVQADVEGEGTAQVSFKAPLVALNGNNLTGNLKVEVYRNDVLAKTFNNLAPGASASFNDVVPESGQTEYRFVPSNSYGSGEESSISAYVGFHQPMTPAYADISRTNIEGEVSLQWGIVTQDIEGVEYPAGSVVYDIYPEDSLTPVASGITTNSYTFMAVQPGKQQMLGYEIRARYGALVSEPAVTTNIPVGTPYDGLWETGNYGSYIWGISSAGGALWSIMDDSSDELPDSFDGDGTYFGCTGYEAGDLGVLFSGLISLEAIENPALTFATYHIPNASGSTDRNEIMVSVKPADSETWSDIWNKDVSEVAPEGGEWGIASVPLSAYAGKVIQIQFSATSVSYPLTLIDGIRVAEGSANNLSIASIKAPLRAVNGTDYSVEVEVENNGALNATAFELRLFQDGSQIDSRQCSGLKSLASVVESFEVHMSAVAQDKVKIRAELVYNADEIASDNVSRTIEVAPKDPGLPKPFALNGSISNGMVSLKWNEPDMGSADGQPVTEDFEDAPSFTDNYGNWTFVDVDNAPVGGLTNTNIPGIITGSTLGSFWIWDTAQLPIGGNGNAHSGDKYLFSLFRHDNKQSDDWAISPELNGDEQTISFWTKSYSASYPEHLQVMVSAEGTDIEDFDMLDNGDITSVPNTWTKYEFTVPAGTRHFALRNYAAGAFMLMIDDVTYIPAPLYENLTLDGYNVYRDGNLMTPTPVASKEWSDTGLEKGRQYTYQVTAVYSGVGESGPSNKVVITGDGSGIANVVGAEIKVYVENGGIVIDNPEGIKTEVFSVSGLQVYSGAQTGTISVPVPKGVYMIRTAHTSFKVIVP